jgi:uncharacterized membrane protein
MTTLIQWVHLMAAVLLVGGMGFLLLILIPSLRVLSTEQRESLAKAVAGRFRWISWSAMVLLLGSGIYSVRHSYWEVPWGTAWKFLTLKIVLSFALFAIFMAITVPFRLFEPLRARRRMWLLVAFILGVVVILISAYLRRG